MKNTHFYWIFFFFIVLALIIIFQLTPKEKKKIEEEIIDSESRTERILINLPQPKLKGNLSVEEALSLRRSVRNYKKETLHLEEISQILWSAQGVTEKETGKRTAPSAGALYPLEIYLVVNDVKDLEKGVYKYLPSTHQLLLIFQEEISQSLAHFAFDQNYIKEAPANLIFTGIFSRTTQKYGERGIRYVYLEAGHSAQNVYLQAESLGLGTVTIGAFDDSKIKELLKLPEEVAPIYIMPIGKK